MTRDFIIPIGCNGALMGESHVSLCYSSWARGGQMGLGDVVQRFTGERQTVVSQTSYGDLARWQQPKTSISLIRHSLLIDRSQVWDRSSTQILK